MEGQKQAVDLLITHAWILCMDASYNEIQDGAIAIQGDTILAVGDSASLEKRFLASQVIDASQRLVMPGLINTHTHSADALFRGLVEDLPLEQWLARLWVAEGQFVNPGTVYWGSLLAYMEMLRAGITTAVDMFWFPEAMAEAARQAGLRLLTGPIFIDNGVADGVPAEQRAVQARPMLESLMGDPLITPIVQAHAVYTVAPVYLRQAGNLADELGLNLHTHASETETEVRNCLDQFGVSPIKHLDNLGLLNERTILAHCVHLLDDEFDLLAKRGVCVAHCPVSNLKVASGIADVRRMVAAGVKVTLGTDGPVSGNDLDPWTTLRLATILQKGYHRDATAMPARQMVSRFTRQAAEALGLGERLGSLEPGKLADLLVINPHQIHAQPIYDPYAILVYSLGRSDVESVLVNGRVVMQQRNLRTIDESEVIDQVVEIGRQIKEFMTNRS